LPARGLCVCVCVCCKVLRKIVNYIPLHRQLIVFVMEDTRPLRGSKLIMKYQLREIVPQGRSMAQFSHHGEPGSSPGPLHV
jgi:hypothetical protein